MRFWEWHVCDSCPHSALRLSCAFACGGALLGQSSHPHAAQKAHCTYEASGRLPLFTGAVRQELTETEWLAGTQVSCSCIA